MKVEELMNELKKNYTVVIVTHNMQQAARISDRTAFFCWVNWWRLAPRTRSSAHPGTSAPGLHLRPVRLMQGGTKQ